MKNRLNTESMIADKEKEKRITNMEYKGCKMDISKCIRKVSNLERVFLWNPNCSVSMITRIKGDVSKEDLRHALESVRHMHPLIGSKIVFDEKNNAWFSTDNVPSPSFKTVHRVSDNQWFKEVQREIQIPFDLEKGPLIRFVLVYSETVSDLVIVCNHSICDGMSLVYLVRDLLDCCINPEKEVKVLHPINIEDILPKRSFSPSSILSRPFMYHINRQWKKHPYYFTQNDSKAIQSAYWEENLFSTVLLELDPPETQTLLKQCRKNDVTIGSAVTTAFIAAHEYIISPFVKNQKQIWIPFDLRRHVTTQIGDVFCMCVRAPRFSYEYNLKKSFWENVSILNKEIHKRVEKLDYGALGTHDFDPNLMDALSCFASFKKVVPNAYTQTENLLHFSQDRGNIAFSIASKSDGMSPGIIPSNLGRLNIPETYGNLQIDRMVFLPVISDSVPLTLGGVSIGDKLVFSMIYPEPKGSNNFRTNEMIQIRNKALEYLGFGYKTSQVPYNDISNRGK